MVGRADLTIACSSVEGDMRIRRRPLFWGLGFVAAGSVALAVQQGYLDRDTVANAWRLWPLILIAVGLSLIAARSRWAVIGTVVSALVIGAIVGGLVAVGGSFSLACGGSDPVSLTGHSGTFGSDASVSLEMNCGTVEVSMTGGDAWTASVGTTGATQPSVTSDPSSLRIRSADVGGWSVERGREKWVIRLPSAPSYSVSVKPNAATVRMDLSGARLDSLSLQPNAGDIHLTLDGATLTSFDLEMNAGSASLRVNPSTTLSGDVQMNAGSLELCAASGVAFRITSSGTAFGTTIDGSGLTRDGDTWETANYATAQQRITLTVHGNAASFTLNPSGGCN
jgi:LiaI-LiaF-like transmembrane region